MDKAEVAVNRQDEDMEADAAVVRNQDQALVVIASAQSVGIKSHTLLGNAA